MTAADFANLGPGTRLDRYELLFSLASGGMASVWLARLHGKHGFERLVALKTILPRFAADPQFRRMFLDEARIAAGIDHPNVAKILDLGEHDGILYIAMEWIEGDSLQRHLKARASRAGAFPMHLALRIVADASAGLHAAHELRAASGDLLGVVHRDVSPHNLLVGANGIVKLIDFGVAKARDRVSDETNVGTLKGKLSFMPPEQARGEAIDRRADVWAMGAVLHQLLVGVAPYEARPSDAATPSSQPASGTPSSPPTWQMIALRRVIAAEPIAALPPSIPAPVAAVLTKALAPRAEDRYETAEAMRGALEAAMRACKMHASAEEVAAFAAGNLGEVAAARRRELDRSLRAARAADEASPSPSSPSGQLVYAAAVGASPMRAAMSSFYPASGSVPSHFGSQPWAGLQGDFGPSVRVPFGPPPPSSMSHSSAPPTATSATIVPRPARSGRRVAVLAALATVAAGASIGFGAIHLQAQAAHAQAVHGGTLAGAVVTPPAPPPVAPAAPSCRAGQVLIEGGRFFMGSDDDLPLEKPAHKVLLGAYCIDVTEVTTAAYKACSDRGDCKRAPNSNAWDGIDADDHATYDTLCNGREPTERGQHPINCVDWDMARTYCAANGGRLPTEAEWEYAARGSDGRRYPWGDDPPGPSRLNACGAECMAWSKRAHAHLDPMHALDDGWATTAPVGSYPAGRSPLGIEDVAGNVSEWVADYYAPYKAGEQANPTGPTEGDARVIRGGAWNGAHAAWVRPTFRWQAATEMRSHGIGFRCAGTPR